ncbi:MAG: DUF6599 family protein [Bryobacteraceae bacterium]|jgi:hypothetical protein
MRAFPALLAVPCLAAASILPETIGPAHRTGESQPALTGRAVWDDYGLKAWEAATYASGAARFTVTAWELRDPTAALAAFDWQRPETAKPSKLAPLAATTRNGMLLVQGQYLLEFAGFQPPADDLAALSQSLKNVDTTALPVLPGYLPAENLVPNSERYITGPASLARFLPGISPSVAGFHFDTEAQLGVFHSPKGPMPLAIFNYPSPQIAMRKVPDFEQLPGAMVKRSGPLVAVLLAPSDRDMAERLLAQVRWQAEVTRDERVPTERDNPGNLLLNIFKLIGILLLFATLSGLLMGAGRVLIRLIRRGEEPEVMISLHLD